MLSLKSRYQILQDWLEMVNLLPGEVGGESSPVG